MEREGAKSAEVEGMGRDWHLRLIPVVRGINGKANGASATLRAPRPWLFLILN